MTWAAALLAAGLVAALLAGCLSWIKAGFARVERHDFIVDQYLVIYQRS